MKVQCLLDNIKKGKKLLCIIGFHQREVVKREFLNYTGVETTCVEFVETTRCKCCGIKDRNVKTGKVSTYSKMTYDRKFPKEMKEELL